MPSQLRVVAEREVSARPERVYAFLADYQQARPRILTEDYLDYQVEEGGRGSGTVISYRLKTARGERPYRLKIDAPGQRLLLERDLSSSLVTTWRVMPAPNERTIVRVVTEWRAGGGLQGFFERTFGPRRVRRVYAAVLERLEAALTNPEP